MNIKTFIWNSMIALFLIPATTYAQDTLLIRSNASYVFDKSVEADFNAVTPFFDKEFLYRLNAVKLAENWNRIQGQVGLVLKNQNHLLFLETNDSIVTVYQPCNFEKKNMDLKLVFNSTNKIIAYSFSAPSGRFTYRPPAWILPGKVREQDIVIPSSDLRLHGKLTLPAEGSRFPLIVLVHGSGPQDMDMSIGPNKIFKDIALSLSAMGFAVIRYDNRSKAYAGELLNMLPYLNPDEETIQDALAAVEFGANNEYVDKNNIFLLGHGIGGMMAPQIATKNKQIKGLILMAANAQPVHLSMLKQLKYLAAADSSLLESVGEMETKVNRITTKDYADTTDLALLPSGIGAPYWRYLDDYNQFKTAVDIKIPMLILQGERDYQVTMDDFKIWQLKLNERPNTLFESFPKLNHYFISGTTKSYPVEYNQRSNVSKEVIESINSWVVKQLH